VENAEGGSQVPWSLVVSEGVGVGGKWSVEHDGRREGRGWGECNGGKGETRAREYVGGERMEEEEHTHKEPSEVI